MSKLKKNIIATFTGKAWNSLMLLIFIPVYIKFMGIESWGLVGVYSTLLTMFGLLDLGLGSTFNREMARLSTLNNSQQEIRNLSRSLEILYWIIALCIGIVIILIAPFLANYWLKVKQLDLKTVQMVLIIIGIVVAFEMPKIFYSNGLMGLQKHVLLNVIIIFISTLRGVGAVLVLWLVSPTIQTYFLWQVGVCVLNNILMAFALWKTLPKSEKKARFEFKLVKGIWKFAAGMTGITILGVILSQLDKIILSKILPLEIFGYYTLASMIALSLNAVFLPIFHGIYPRLTELVSLKDHDKLKQLYHEGSQFMAVIILPVTLVIAVFSHEILLLWTKSPITADNAYQLVRILICAYALNGLMHLPYALQLANGWTSLGLKINLFLIIIYVPTILFFTKQFGAIGAGLAWICINLTYMLLGVPLTHRRYLKGETLKWFKDLIFTLLSVLIALSFGRFTYLKFIAPKAMFISITLTFVLTLSVAILSSAYTRRIIKQKLKIS